MKANFVKFVLREGILEKTLQNVIDSCVKYWIGVIKDEGEREELFDLYEELLEQADKKRTFKGASSDKYASITSKGKGVVKKKITAAKSSNTQEEFSDDDGGTLEYAMNLIESDPEDEEKPEPNGNKGRKEHELSDSGGEMEEESQEMKHWSKQKAEDGDTLDVENHELGSEEFVEGEHGSLDKSDGSQGKSKEKADDLHDGKSQETERGEDSARIRQAGENEAENIVSKGDKDEGRHSEGEAGESQDVIKVSDISKSTGEDTK